MITVIQDYRGRDLTVEIHEVRTDDQWLALSRQWSSWNLEYKTVGQLIGYVKRMAKGAGVAGSKFHIITNGKCVDLYHERS